MKTGGRRTGAGRPKGVQNKTTKEARATIGELARHHADEAIMTLVHVATNGQSESARVAAANALLDRGYGRPSQSMELTGSDGQDLMPKAPSGVLIVPATMSEDEWEAMMKKHA